MPPGAWPNWVLGNHDRPRLASRVGPAQARVAAMLLLTLRGTPTLYYGDEIGMRQVADPAGPRARSVPRRIVPGRDGCRTPMQWDAQRLRRIFDRRALAAAGGGFRRHAMSRPSAPIRLPSQSLPPAARPAPHPAGADRAAPIGSLERGAASVLDLSAGGEPASVSLVALNFGAGPSGRRRCRQARRATILTAIGCRTVMAQKLGRSVPLAAARGGHGRAAAVNGGRAGRRRAITPIFQALFALT